MIVGVYGRSERPPPGRDGPPGRAGPGSPTGPVRGVAPGVMQSPPGPITVTPPEPRPRPGPRPGPPLPPASRPDPTAPASRDRWYTPRFGGPRRGTAPAAALSGAGARRIGRLIEGGAGDGGPATARAAAIRPPPVSARAAAPATPFAGAEAPPAVDPGPGGWISTIRTTSTDRDSNGRGAWTAGLLMSTASENGSTSTAESARRVACAAADMSIAMPSLRRTRVSRPSGPGHGPPDRPLRARPAPVRLSRRRSPHPGEAPPKVTRVPISRTRSPSRRAREDSPAGRGPAGRLIRETALERRR